ncbi:pyridoxal phosphate-dependent aminotransferase [Wenxinia marina]|uniref:histidinol-phosphate transaminase n=1 Tax=Wenxinia marina DSM 24838 TaxID=1123501 RepID=A0A0D0QBG5_9RHOB|nr:pyridoxal phosphate-dependent aminotransferase [Wenxinia marina]KIQ68268.1 Histidinol-phosphate/aromatic aminotransferase and cobyric acid decarboxylase [Wenxinia marina DSM 24838]GGL79265.1 histidinol-phosphate aminotransferase [Wenxinia marina]
MSDPRLTPLAASLPAKVPFVGPEAQERTRGRRFAARLGANESVFGPSPRAVQAMADAARDTWMYGDPESHDLRHALAAHHRIRPANVMVGPGIDGLLGLTVRLYCGPGTPVVSSAGAYPTFDYHVAGFGAAMHKVPYREDAEDPEALIATAAEVGARLIYIANPDNPMGTWHDAATVSRMIDAVPDGALLLLDEAYVEFAPEGMAPPIDPDDPRVLRFRTFSKAYGLAGARVGYVIGAAEQITAYDKVRDHFGMSRVSQAGALAALADAEWLAHVQAEVAATRERIAAIGRACGLTPLPSATNFVTLDCGADGAFARAVLAALTERDVFVRKPFAPPEDRCIRISCGTPADLDLLERALPEALAAAREGAAAT